MTICTRERQIKTLLEQWSQLCWATTVAFTFLFVNGLKKRVHSWTLDVPGRLVVSDSRAVSSASSVYSLYFKLRYDRFHWINVLIWLPASSTFSQTVLLKQPSLQADTWGNGMLFSPELNDTKHTCTQTEKRPIHSQTIWLNTMDIQHIFMRSSARGLLFVCTTARHLRNTQREFLQMWHKCQLGLEDELICA